MISTDGIPTIACPGGMPPKPGKVRMTAEEREALGLYLGWGPEYDGQQPEEVDLAGTLASDDPALD